MEEELTGEATTWCMALRLHWHPLGKLNRVGFGREESNKSIAIASRCNSNTLVVVGRVDYTEETEKTKYIRDVYRLYPNLSLSLSMSI